MTPLSDLDRWTIPFSVVVGVGSAILAVALSDCRRKTGSVFSRTLSPQARLEAQRDLEDLRRELSEPLVSGKCSFELSNGSFVLGREIEREGNCFFLCYAISLLEYIRKDLNYLSFFLDVIEEDEILSPLEKQRFKAFLIEVKELQSDQLLERFFEDNRKMSLCVNCLRALMVSSVKNKPDYDFFGDILSKEQIYADLIGGFDEEDIAVYRLNEEFSPQEFEKMLKFLRNERLWPSDFLIRELFVKLNAGLAIFQDEKGLQRSYFDVRDLGIPEAGSVLLGRLHYEKIYPAASALNRRAILNEMPEKELSETSFVSIYSDSSENSQEALD